MGLGAEPARVRLTLRIQPQPGAVAPEAAGAHGILQKLLDLMEVNATAETAESAEEEEIALSIEGEDAGLLIGRQGTTLQDIQTIVNVIAGRQLGSHVPIRIDVEGYRQRRTERIQQIALRAAQRVQERRRPVVLEPMPAAERRIVHMTLANHPDVVTESVGEGRDRQVTIYPRS